MSAECPAGMDAFAAWLVPAPALAAATRPPPTTSALLLDFGDGSVAPAGPDAEPLPEPVESDIASIASLDKLGALIPTGPSPHSGHRLDEFVRCPQLYAWRSVVNRLPWGADSIDPYDARVPLVRGSLGHLCLALHYQRMQEEQGGHDPSRWAEPVAGMRAFAERAGPAWAKEMDLVQAGYEDYCLAHAGERLVVQAVEVAHDFSGLYGLAHTRALDLRAAWGRHRGCILDHKWVGRITDRTIARYQMDGQMLDLCILAESLWGRRNPGDPNCPNGGVWLNLCEWAEGRGRGGRAGGSGGRGGGGSAPSPRDLMRRFQRVEVKPRRGLLEGRKRLVARVKRNIAALLKIQPDANRWIEAGFGRMSESVCNGAYGLCPGYELCWSGP